MKKILFTITCALLLFNSFAQTIVECNNVLINDAYNLAVNTVKINVRRGILAAGGDYGGEWVRDIAINSWNSASLLLPGIAEKSLWSVTINKDTIGHQYWDKIIWVIAAYNHHKITGNKVFLKQAYFCSKNTMQQLEETQFDNHFGLFNGPSVFNDGIAGYPSPIYDSSNLSSFVLDYPRSKTIKCLSTNCVYYGAYQALKEMALLLNKNDDTTAYNVKAANLKQNILQYLFDKNENRFNYFIDENGTAYQYQEALGLSFAVIFGIVDNETAKQIISNAKVSAFGITSVYPDFTRFSKEKPGRHNNIIWPMVNGFFAQAAIASQNFDVFDKELFNLAHLAIDADKGDYNFREIYNPYTGAPDGGWQSNHQWNSCRYQTWSATAFINMVHNGLLGIRIKNNGLKFQPYLPDEINYLKLTDIIYRNAKLNVVLKGNGEKIKSFLLNRKKQNENFIPSTIKGNNEIVIELE